MNTFLYAMSIEDEGEAFYRKQALKNKDNPLGKVFTILALDEKRHGLIIKHKLESLPYQLADRNTLDTSRRIFKKDEVFTINYKSKEEQLDIYRLALVKEKESIDLYTDLLEQSENEIEKQLCIYLIRQEKEHYKVIEDMVIMLNRPNDWVESAEFGKREEY